MKSMAGGTPQLMPVLSRGKHRTPRTGGCFMEFASYLAGEAWSDHPACTHPMLASLARMVNDCTSDDARSRLAALIPSVIGLRGGDERVGLLLALRAATSALPVAGEHRQHALAVGILTCERHLGRLEGRPPGDPRSGDMLSGDMLSGDTAERSRHAFAQAPGTEAWAREFIGSVGLRPRSRFTPATADSILRVAVQGIAEACIPDADARLHDLLAAAIEDCAGLLGAPERALKSRVPADVPAASVPAASVPAASVPAASVAAATVPRRR
jgi:hypothetical protein